MHRLSYSENKIDNTCLTFGVFDGVHIGHRAVIDRLMLSKANLKTVAVILQNNSQSNNGELYTIEEKTSIFREFGFDTIETIPLSKKIHSLTPEDFVNQQLVSKFHPRKIVAGEDCIFGNDKKGSIYTLKNLSNKFCYIVETCPNIPNVSTEKIKELLKTADTKKATELLGDIYTITGEVVHGRAIGRTVGMSTANIRPYKNKFIPAHGVYATITEINGSTHKGITNIGMRPSIDERKEITIENHIFDFDKDIYGKVISIKLYDYIRGVKKFDGIAELKNQVTHDIRIVQTKLEEQE